MKLCRLLTVAAAGWYLITPSFNEQNQLNLTAPLSYWAVVQDFDSAKKCEDFRAAMQKKVAAAPPIPPANAHEAAQAAKRYAQCISSDDPRLRGQ